MALLHILLEAGYRNLVLCHLNHMLRGTESSKDAALVRRLAKKHDLPCEVVREDVNKLMLSYGESMELAARNARHRFFAHCARRFRCQRVLLAHHADDQAETILFNLLRGSQGLRGMRFSSLHTIEDKKLTILRPLLDTTRGEIDVYVNANRISYREDASNAEEGTTRNRLRNRAIPMLNEIMGREVRSALIRAEAASQRQQKAIEAMLATMKLRDPKGRLFLPKIAVLPPALQLSVLHDYLKEHEVNDISQELLERCACLISNVDVAKVNLPGKRFLRRKQQRLFIS